MINNTKKFGKFADIVFDGRRKVGKKVKLVSKVGYYLFVGLACASFAYMILELLKLGFLG